VPNGQVTTQLAQPNRPADWWAAAAPFAIVGVACVVAGGLISAAVASSPSENSSWAVAYLVLIGGVAQVALGVGQSRLAGTAPSRRILTAEFVCWNAGNAAVITGQLLGYPWVIDAGGAMLVAALALLFRGVRGSTAGTSAETWLLYAYRVILLIVLISIPIGLVLGHIKAA
jgi:hypothetical protein